MKMAKESRQFAKYFKLGFFGAPFPELLANKEFIFRAPKRLSRIGNIIS